MKYIFLVFITFQLHSQSASDSLKGKSIDYLFERYSAVSELYNKHAYSEAIIYNSKSIEDTTSLIAGYHFKAKLFNNNKSLIYLDSIIALKTNNTDNYQPASSFIFKGNIYYQQRKLKLALDNYFKALELITKHENKSLNFRCNHYMAIVKYELGDYKNALEILKNNLKYIEGYKDQRQGDFFNTLFAISEANNKLKQIDSAKYYINYGLKESNIFNNSIYLNYFKLTEGVNYYLRDDYDQAYQIFKQCIPKLIEIKDESNLAVAYYYLAKIEQKTKNIKEAIFYFENVVALYKKNKKVNSYIRDAYQELFLFYKEQDNDKRQLNYITSLIEIDSILHVNEVYLNKGIIRKYDIPILISEKENIIKAINRENNTKNIVIVTFLLLVIFLIVVLIYQLIKKDKYKKRFVELSKKNNTPILAKIKTKNSSINISKDIITRILKDLKAFEENKEFLDYDITLTFLAKKMKTNSKYLSNIISDNKNESYINYINRLRINYAVSMLKNDSNYRKYTVKAISNEVGFKKAESFSRAFKKVTGITPTYFINELNNKN